MSPGFPGNHLDDTQFSYPSGPSHRRLCSCKAKQQPPTNKPTNQLASQPTNQPTNKQTTNNNAAFPENCLIHGRVYLIAPHCNTLMNCSNIGENVQLRPETPVMNCEKHSYKRGNIIPWMSFFTDLKLVFRATTVYTKKQLTMHQAFWWPRFDVSFSSSTSNRLQDLGSPGRDPVAGACILSPFCTANHD